jgi:hypothetical protein
MPSEGATSALVNDQTDRVYLVSQKGAVQCLHELGAEQPFYHVVPEPETPPAEAAEGQPTETVEPETTPEPPADVTPPADDEDPFGAEDPEDAAEEPGAEAEMPGDDAAAEEDPFGGT